MRQSGTNGAWRGRAAWGQAEIRQMQGNYIVGASLQCLRGPCSPPDVCPPELDRKIEAEDQFTSFSRFSVNKCPWITAKADHL